MQPMNGGPKVQAILQPASLTKLPLGQLRRAAGVQQAAHVHESHAGHMTSARLLREGFRLLVTSQKVALRVLFCKSWRPGLQTIVSNVAQVSFDHSTGDQRSPEARRLPVRKVALLLGEPSEVDRGSHQQTASGANPRVQILPAFDNQVLGCSFVLGRSCARVPVYLVPPQDASLQLQDHQGSFQLVVQLFSVHALVGSIPCHASHPSKTCIHQRHAAICANDWLGIDLLAQETPWPRSIM